MAKTSNTAKGGKIKSANNEGFSGAGNLPHANGKGPYGPGKQPGHTPGSGSGGKKSK